MSFFDHSTKGNFFCKNNFRYVAPVQKFLGYNQYGKPCKFHYVSLKQTLMSMLQDKSVMECLEWSSFVEQEVFRDLHDGKVYKHICQTVEHSSFLELILYQDAFEVVNPLGSARKIHKVVAVLYYIWHWLIYPVMPVPQLTIYSWSSFVVKLISLTLVRTMSSSFLSMNYVILIFMESA